MVPNQELRNWSMQQSKRATAGEVAAMLARLENLGDLRYREIRLRARAVDVTPCDGEENGRFFRYFVLRALGRPLLQPGLEAPEEWRSEVLIMPRSADHERMARLGEFEVEFAVRSFLTRVEQEIDAVLGRVEDRERSLARG